MEMVQDQDQDVRALRVASSFASSSGRLFPFRVKGVHAHQLETKPYSRTV